jgi:hypothetical protein
VPALRVDGNGAAPGVAARPSVGVDDPGVPAARAPYAGPTGAAFVPYGVGYVELAGEVRVETRLTTTEGLRIGMDMELVLVPSRTDDDGNEVVTFAFRPVGGASLGL